MIPGSVHPMRDPISYALESDSPLGAAGFEPLHLMRTHQDSPPSGRDSNLCISQFEFTETLSLQDSNLRISMRKLVGSAALISDAQGEVEHAHLLFRLSWHDLHDALAVADNAAHGGTAN